MFDKPPGLRKQSSSDSRGGARKRYNSVPESSQFKLFQGKLCIDHFLVDLTYEGDENTHVLYIYGTIAVFIHVHVCAMNRA